MIALLAPCVYHKLAGYVATTQKNKGKSSDSSCAPPSSSRSSRCLSRVRACWTPLVAVCCMQVMSLVGDFATDIAVYSAMVLRGELPCQFGGLGDKISCEEYTYAEQAFVDTCNCNPPSSATALMHFDAECNIVDFLHGSDELLKSSFEASCVLQIDSHACTCRNLKALMTSAKLLIL
jgi:hypothetical protein